MSSLFNDYFSIYVIDSLKFISHSLCIVKSSRLRR